MLARYARVTNLRVPEDIALIGETFDTRLAKLAAAVIGIGHLDRSGSDQRIMYVQSHQRDGPTYQAWKRGAIDLALAGVPVERTATLVGLAGSITTVAAHALGLPEYDRAAINGAVIDIDDAIKACDELLASSRAERAALGFMHPGRVDVIGAGALVWKTVMQRVRSRSAMAWRTCGMAQSSARASSGE